MTDDTTPQFIARMASHFDGEGRRIDEFQVVSGEFPEGLAKFVAHHQIADLKASMKFPIHAETIVEAYEKLAEKIEAVEADFRKKHRDQQNNKLILTAQDMPTSIG